MNLDRWAKYAAVAASLCAVAGVAYSLYERSSDQTSRILELELALVRSVAERNKEAVDRIDENGTQKLEAAVKAIDAETRLIEVRLGAEISLLEKEQATRLGIVEKEQSFSKAERKALTKSVDRLVRVLEASDG